MESWGKLGAVTTCDPYIPFQGQDPGQVELLQTQFSLLPSQQPFKASVWSCHFPLSNPSWVPNCLSYKIPKLSQVLPNSTCISHLLASTLSHVPLPSAFASLGDSDLSHLTGLLLRWPFIHSQTGRDCSSWVLLTLIRSHSLLFVSMCCNYFASCLPSSVDMSSLSPLHLCLLTFT